jgi:hypothetical protein
VAVQPCGVGAGPFKYREAAISAAIRGASLKTHKEGDLQSGAPRRRGIDACLHREISWRPRYPSAVVYLTRCLARKIGRAYRPSDLSHRVRGGSYISAGSVAHLAGNALSHRRGCWLVPSVAWILLCWAFDPVDNFEERGFVAR